MTSMINAFFNFQTLLHVFSVAYLFSGSEISDGGKLQCGSLTCRLI